MSRNGAPRNPNFGRNTAPQQGELEIDQDVSLQLGEVLNSYQNLKFETAVQVVDSLADLRAVGEGSRSLLKEGTQVDPKIRSGFDRELRLGIDKFELSPGGIKSAESEAAGNRPLRVSKERWADMQDSKGKDPKDQARDQALLAGFVSDAKRRLALSEDVRMYKIANDLASNDIVPMTKNGRSYVMREKDSNGKLIVDRNGKSRPVPRKLTDQNMEVLQEHKQDILDGTEEITKERLAHEQGIRDANVAPIDEARREDRRRIAELIGHFPGDMKGWMVERGIAVNAQNVAKHIEAFKADYTRTELMQGHPKPKFEAKPVAKATKTERVRNAIAGGLAKAAVAVAVSVPGSVAAVPARAAAAPRPSASPTSVSAPAVPGAELLAAEPESEEISLARKIRAVIGNVALKSNVMYLWNDKTQVLSEDTMGVFDSLMPGASAESDQSPSVKVKFDAKGNVVKQSKHKPSKHGRNHKKK